MTVVAPSSSIIINFDKWDQIESTDNNAFRTRRPKGQNLGSHLRQKETKKRLKYAAKKVEQEVENQTKVEWNIHMEAKNY